LAYGLAFCVYRLRAKEAGSGFALVGVGALLAFLAAEVSGAMARICEITPSVPWPLVITGFSLACLLGSISFKIRERSRKLQALEIRSRRLETELLKKSIQPHFIMNTLFSIKSLTSQNPPKAERLIEALAEEFRVISRIASEKEIGLEDEVGLCRSHLELMGLRRDASYDLLVEGACPGEKIPPMVFHTLIENGLTHSYLPKENGTFRLSCERTGGEVVYRLRNDGTRIQRIIGLPEDKIEEGLGLKYVKARLEESYPGRWRLDYGVREGFWDVKIVVPGKV
jgi:LytS/YehU family sensor histidine kinase